MIPVPLQFSIDRSNITLLINIQAEQQLIQHSQPDLPLLKEFEKKLYEYSNDIRRHLRYGDTSGTQELNCSEDFDCIWKAGSSYEGLVRRVSS